jgi:hypothetical protein
MGGATSPGGEMTSAGAVSPGRSILLPVLGGGSGAATLVFFMVLAWLESTAPVPSEARFFVAAALALGGGLSTAFIGGSVVAEGRIGLPFAQKHPFQFSMFGGVAVLIVLLCLGYYFYAAPENCRQKIDLHETAMVSNFTTGRYADALSKAEDVLRLDAKNGRALNIRGGVHFYRGEYKAARRDFGEAVRYPSAKFNVGIAYRNLGDTYVELGHYDLALEAYKHAPASEEKTYSVGRAYLHNQQHEEALAMLKTIEADYRKGSAKILVAAALSAKAVGANGPARAQSPAPLELLLRGTLINRLSS